MSVKIYKYHQDKSEVLPLYIECFPEDNGDYINNYKKLIIPDNTILAYEKNGKIISALHLNPVNISFFGKKIRSYYIYAVGTLETERRKKYMSSVLKAALHLMEDENIPICYLLPVNPNIYKSFGFISLKGYDDLDSVDEFDIYNVHDKVSEGRDLMKELFPLSIDESSFYKDKGIMMKIIDEDTLKSMLPDNLKNSSSLIDVLKNAKIHMDNYV